MAEPIQSSLRTSSQFDESNRLDTRKILRENAKDKTIYYVPAYLRLKVKNFTEINLQKLEAQMNATIILTVYYKGLDPRIVDAIQKNIILHLIRDDPIKLTEEDHLDTQVRRDPNLHQIRFVTRRLYHLSIESDVFWSPFEIIYLLLTVTVNPVITQWGTVKFNLMDTIDSFQKLSYTQTVTFGNYDLAEALTRTQFTNDRDYHVDTMKLPDAQRLQIYKQNMIQTNKINQRLESFQKAHFSVPLYKYPVVSLATIFIPLWLLAIINLAIFFQGSLLGERIASIAAVMIASVALMPTIRSQIPPNPQIVFVQILVFLQTGSSLLTLIHSVMIRNIKNYQIVWYQSGLFLVALFITWITVMVIGILTGIHFCYWLPSYKNKINVQTQINFQRKKWSNRACDWYFSKMKEKNEQIKQFSGTFVVDEAKQIKKYKRNSSCF